MKNQNPPYMNDSPTKGVQKSFGFFALLYNPIIPIHLGSKGLWVIVNLVTAGVFIANKDKA